MKIVNITINKDLDGSVIVNDGVEMTRGFIEAFKIPAQGYINAKMTIYKKGKIVIEKTKKQDPIRVDEIGNK